jgi:tetratricopeptide (TPR) repeat protein
VSSILTRLLSASLLDAFSPGTVLILMVMAAVTGLWIMFRVRGGFSRDGRGNTKVTGDSPTRPLPIHPGNSQAVLDDERLTDSDLDLREFMKTPVPAPGDPNYVPTLAECEAEEAKDLRNAGALWLRRGDLPRALGAFERVGAHLEAGRTHRAIGNTERALEHLRQALQGTPLDEELRIEIVDLLLDLDRATEARQLVEAVSGALSDQRASAKFFERIGRSFEAAERDVEALDYYNRAVAENNALVSVLIRLRYLGEINRLRDVAAGRAKAPDPAQLMKQVLETSSDIGSMTASKRAPLRAIVGHLALGGSAETELLPVRSPSNRALRFDVDRLISTTDDTATFFGSDAILDVPVTLRMFALHKEFASRFLDLERRMKLLAHLSHPNLGRLTYADRDDELLRVVQEYIPGGTLREFVGKLPAVGVPLLIRLLVQVAHALEAVHRLGIIHGDVRMETIYLSHDQRLKLTDFVPFPTARTGDDDTDPAAWVAGAEPKAVGFGSDLLQFAQVMDDMVEIGKGRLAGTPAANAAPDTEFGAELKDLAMRIRTGELSSAGKVRQSLEESLEKFMAAVGAARARQG